MLSENQDVKRKRANSLRTQMFNKHLYSKFTGTATDANDSNETEEVELDEVENNEGNFSSSNGFFAIQEDLFEDEEDVQDGLEQKTPNKSHKINLLTRILDLFLDRRRMLRSENGRHIPISLDHSTEEYTGFVHSKSGLLIDERTNRPYINNAITSSRYTVYSFLPKQFFAQFSKLANTYFLVIAILQMIPGWSTTGTYTTIVPLLIFMAISMAREAYDDFRRHILDRAENRKLCKVLVKDRRTTPELDSTDPNETDSKDQGTHFTNFKLLANNHNVYLADTEWKDLRVGDFILLQQDEWVPADILLLTCDGENNESFIETMALDGETTLKNRVPHQELHKIACSASGLANINARMTLEDPNNDLYNFEGNLELHDTQNNTLKEYPLGPENIVYRGSIVRNTQYIVGMVIYSGEETKVRMNAIKNPRTKAPKLQKQINIIIAFLVFVVATISLFSYLGHVLANKGSIDGNKAWYLWEEDAGPAATIMSFIIMYNTMIPLSLYVSMEIVKVAQSKLMEWDIDMYYEETDTPFEARTATILEELGQVSYIFSDKTGTLTDNKMIFRKFTLLGSSWVHNIEPAELNSEESGSTDVDMVSVDNQNILNSSNLASHINRPNEIYSHHSPRTSIEYKGNSSATYAGRPSMSSLFAKQNQWSAKKQSLQNNFITPLTENLKTTFDLIKFLQMYPDMMFSQKAKFFILSIALCHACIPKRADGVDTEDDVIEYQSSSPDELALITAARDMGYVLTNRSGQTLTIKTYPNGFDASPVLDEYEILNYIDFNSHRKRMSVLVRVPNENNRILLICKGADNVILERLHNKDLALEKLNDINDVAAERKEDEAELVIQQRKSLERVAYDEGIPRSSLRGSMSNDGRASMSLQAIRKSVYQRNKKIDPEMQIDTLDDVLATVRKGSKDLDAVVNKSRKSLHLQQLNKYGPKTSIDMKVQNEIGNNFRRNVKENAERPTSVLEYIGSDELMLNEEYVLEKTIQAIDDFSTEGLRTLMFAYKWIDNNSYNLWNKRFHAAQTSLNDRKVKTDRVGAEIERDLFILGATAIEDKLQEGVPETIEKIKRAGIKLWMLTGDKRETAINIGYSCKLIYDYSTVVILTTNDENIISKMNAISQELDFGNMAHCVIVIDGATLSFFESNPTMMSVFVELCTKTDAVICCRASPSQKALMVSNIRETNRNTVTLAIGDGANDIAMIQAADIGIGIAGREGLQASRSADYSFGQFRFLLKLLLVHGRYNYIRTAKFLLCTFYKEATFYMTQLIYQRYTLFSGTSFYESWSLSMYNTLFTSLPTICIGMFEKDLKPITLLTVPELYSFGRLSEGFNIWIFLEWLCQASGNALLVTFLNVIIWGETSLSDNSMYPLGVVNFTAIITLVAVKFQFLEMRNKNWLAFTAFILSAGGWIVWVCALPVLHRTNGEYDVKYGFYHHFGKDITFWCTCLVLTTLPLIIDVVYQTVKRMLWPSDVDIFANLEKKGIVRKKLELGAYNEMRQGWTWDKDPNFFQRYMNAIFGPSQCKRAPSNGRSRADSYLSSDEQTTTAPSSIEPRSSDITVTSWPLHMNKLMPGTSKPNMDDYEVLPSGKILKKDLLAEEANEETQAMSQSQHSDPASSETNSGTITRKITKKLRFKSDEVTDEEAHKIIQERLKSLE
ncbi:aminophospholipid-translocating P4-type ATPase DNF3 KNAG_0I00850 [Huiozyma naganishii CBS 8797]|uniref:Phospholipid-transporting ATPase n=1 Tax=Huiozyma naganishii (strain ATCC MYA-139 / BCRC 22969 / CBS 8797 / KCTC 17520 / NBRC 10181 / NCYC 3082 / Yp74L-3) TaxID=1071383 RepID=J7SA31_HUIN7|nr:hypothetical protein KNAG_0I00850 [Kazachstania naganishii CBS 8797]CCK71876.1 hypothetical protein KNAG_0I00850 [Kazachstania naganishii CBS 8797]